MDDERNCEPEGIKSRKLQQRIVDRERVIRTWESRYSMIVIAHVTLPILFSKSTLKSLSPINILMIFRGFLSVQKAERASGRSFEAEKPAWTWSDLNINYEAQKIISWANSWKRNSKWAGRWEKTKRKCRCQYNLLKHLIRNQLAPPNISFVYLNHL